jgi:hypothetical protein
MRPQPIFSISASVCAFDDVSNLIANRCAQKSKKYRPRDQSFWRRLRVRCREAEKQIRTPRLVLERAGGGKAPASVYREASTQNLGFIENVMPGVSARCARSATGRDPSGRSFVGFTQKRYRGGGRGRADPVVWLILKTRTAARHRSWFGSIPLKKSAFSELTSN